MTIGTALRTHLLADAAITAVVAQRIYPLRLPQKAVLPAVVLTRISDVRMGGHLRGNEALARVRYQVDAWASTHDDATALGTLCRQRLNGYAGRWTDAVSPATEIPVTILFEEARDFFEEDILGGLCRHSADYFLYHGTADGSV